MFTMFTNLPESTIDAYKLLFLNQTQRAVNRLAGLLIWRLALQTSPNSQRNKGCCHI